MSLFCMPLYCLVVGVAAQEGSTALSERTDDLEPPALVKRYMHWGYWYHHYRHRAGAYFKGPNVEQTFYDFLVRLPLLKSSLRPTDRPPMVIQLHAKGGDYQRHERGWPDHVVLNPDDNTAKIGHSGWFGYHELAPAQPRHDTPVVPYTHRRLLYYIRFAIQTFNVDPNRIWITGGSMGGGGALLFALHHPEWVAGATVSKPPIDLRILPLLRQTAEQSLGPVDWQLKVAGTDVNAWHYTSGTWLLSRQPACRAWLEIHHGRRDQVIPFEQYYTSVTPPGQSFLQMLEQGAAPGLFAWDMSTHERPDPLGSWQPNFRPLSAGLIRVNRPILVFGNPSNGHWGACGPTGEWESNRRPERDPRGMINAFCRWDGDTLIDRPDRFEVRIWADDQVDMTRRSPVEGIYRVSPRGTQSFPIPPRCSFRYEIAPDGPRGHVTSTDAGLLVIDGVPLPWGRANAATLRIQHNMTTPVVGITSPTHPTITPRAPTTAVIRWTVANSTAEDPLPVDRYRCWIAHHPHADAPSDCDTPRSERVFESLKPGCYHVMAQARLVTGQWGPITSREINIDPASPVR